MATKFNREVTKWGTFGKNGDEDLKFVPIKDLGDEHIANILKNEVLEENFKCFLIDELYLRITNPELSLKETK